MIKVFVSKILRGLSYFSTTVMSRLQYGNKLKVDGAFRKRREHRLFCKMMGNAVC